MKIDSLIRRKRRSEQQENEKENAPIMEDEQDLSEMEVVEDSDSEEEDDDDSDAQSVDSDEFKEKIGVLTDEARRIGKEIEETNTKEKDLDLSRNCDEGKKLAELIGGSPTKGVSSFTHVTALAETALTKAKKVGATCNIFSVSAYMDILQATCQTDGEYDPSKLFHLMGQHYMKCSRGGYSSMSTMVGLVDFNAEEPEDVELEKTRRVGRPKFEKQLTQHQVVNNNGREPAAEERSVDASRRNAKKVKNICKQQGKTSLPLINYGLAGAAEPHEFVRNVFDMAVAARDGYAAVEENAENESESPESQHELSQLSVQATKPPETESGDMEMDRQQRIVSFKAKDIKEFFARMQLQQQQQHQSETDESD